MPTTASSPLVAGTPEVVWDAQAQLGEGLCWSPQRQAMYWVDILGRRLMRFDLRDHRQHAWDFDETISAVAERANGGGLIVSLRRRIALFEPDSGTLDALPEAEPQLPGNRFNDGKCDAQGRFWACTMDFDCRAPTGSLYRVTAAQAAPQMSRGFHAKFPVVNGPAWSADGRTLWLNDTVHGTVYALDFDADSGEVWNPRPWLQFADDDGVPDGMTIDAEGRLWIAHWGGACVTCHDPRDACELARIALPTSNVTNVAFGGADLSTLFVSTASIDLDASQRAAQRHAGALFRVQMNAHGLPPHRFAG